MTPLSVTHFSDPGCPWAYSAWPALATLQWRYGDQLQWRLVLIGLAESPARYERDGYTAVRMASGYLRFERRFAMPFGRAVRSRVAATGRACRAVVATRLLAPEHEIAAFRALQFAQFTTGGLFDTDEVIGAALRTVPGLDAAAVVGALDAPATEEAYQADWREARTAEGSPTAFQGRTANTDGHERYTAPSLIFTTADGRSLEVGGFQHLDAYDAAIANLDTSLQRRPAPEDPVDAVRAFGHGLTTAEVAAITTPHLGEPDPHGAEVALLAAVAEGAVTATPLGTSTLWRAAG